ncbi:MAG: SNF2-related protein, partial [Deltaproteobacteria bacterium]|nr:SNF2-related protein [Deltaproteobacteria bacterium]
DTYRAYERFLRKRNFRKAYQCLESLLQQFPGEEALLVDIVNLAYFDWDNYGIARPWLIKLAQIRSVWRDYLLLSRGEARLGNGPRAREYLNRAKELLDKRGSPQDRKEAKAAFGEVEDWIKYWEWKLLSKPKVEKIVTAKEKGASPPAGSPDVSAIRPASEGMPSPKPTVEKPQEKSLPKPIEKPAPPAIPEYSVPVSFSLPGVEAQNEFQSAFLSPLKEIKLLIDYTHLTIQGGFDELLCLNAINNVERYWFQIETVKKVLKYFRGRVLLCDEVGLGKTIEAGMVIKEYLMRNMVRNVLILTPSALVSQWKEEMETKFGIEFMTTDDVEASDDPERFWNEKYLIVSLNLAKSKKNMPVVTQRFYDLVVVDEAHHLRNRTTQAWKLINQIQKRFILLLSATPLQNNLIELFNLITLLKPGQFKTEKIFRQEYLMKGNLRKPSNRDKMRELLRDVMIRNTRSIIDLKLPRRFATTLRIEPAETERKIYQGLNNYLRKDGLNRLTLNLLLREAGSSPFALKKSLLQLPGEDGEKQRIIEWVDSLEEVSKGKALLDLVRKNSEEKKVIFTQYVKSLEYITDLFKRNGIRHVIFKGTLTAREKNAAIEQFRDEAPVLVSTESGGEGRNLQFCNTLINFDLPWNPMRIEQRIGRLHRIGQTRDVFVFNLSVKETLEDYVIDLLDNKINMFEMVIGEI